MKKWEEEQRQKAHVKRVIAAKPTLSKLLVTHLLETKGSVPRQAQAVPVIASSESTLINKSDYAPAPTVV